MYQYLRQPAGVLRGQNSDRIRWYTHELPNIFRADVLRNASMIAYGNGEDGTWAIPILPNVLLPTSLIFPSQYVLIDRAVITTRNTDIPKSTLVCFDTRPSDPWAST